MKLLTPCELSLQRVAGQPPQAAPVCEIVRQAQPTGVRVPGAVLEAAGQWQGFFLVLTTDDVPFEDALHLHLLDAQLRRLDCATLGAPYSTGSFAVLPSPQADVLRFRFIGDTDWSVQILPAPGFRLPWLGEPRGVQRAWGFSRHFIVRGHPQRGG